MEKPLIQTEGDEIPEQYLPMLDTALRGLVDPAKRALAILEETGPGVRLEYNNVDDRLYITLMRIPDELD